MFVVFVSLALRLSTKVPGDSDSFPIICMVLVVKCGASGDLGWGILGQCILVVTDMGRYGRKLGCG